MGGRVYCVGMSIRQIKSEIKTIKAAIKAAHPYSTDWFNLMERLQCRYLAERALRS